MDAEVSYEEVPPPAYVEFDDSLYQAPPDYYSDVAYDGNIEISDEVWEEDPYLELEPEDTWIPLPPRRRRPSPTSKQQVIISQQPSRPFFPAPVELSQGYCSLYPHECAGTGRLPGVDTTRLGDQGETATALKNVDLSGLGLVVLIAFVLLIALHVGWGGESAEKGQSRWRSRRRCLV
jgi:hypothetical protein